MKNGRLQKRKKQARDKEPIVQGSDNVYADLGYPNPDEMLAKAEVVRQIVNILRARGLTQTRAAELLGLTQPKISSLISGKFRGYSLDRLLRFLNALDQNVEIIIRPKPGSQENAFTRVRVE